MGKVPGMTDLLSQEQFEQMLRPRRATEEGITGKYAPFACIAFGADWCGPCKRIDKGMIVKATPGAEWYYCDVDVNSYTHGYCELSAIPSYVLLKDGTFAGKLEGPRDALHVLEWLSKNGVSVVA